MYLRNEINNYLYEIIDRQDNINNNYKMRSSNNKGISKESIFSFDKSISYLILLKIFFDKINENLHYHDKINLEMFDLKKQAILRSLVKEGINVKWLKEYDLLNYELDNHTYEENYKSLIQTKTVYNNAEIFRENIQEYIQNKKQDSIQYDYQVENILALTNFICNNLIEGMSYYKVHYFDINFSLDFAKYVYSLIEYEEEYNANTNEIRNIFYPYELEIRARLNYSDQIIYEKNLSEFIKNWYEYKELTSDELKKIDENTYTTRTSSDIKKALEEEIFLTKIIKIDPSFHKKNLEEEERESSRRGFNYSSEYSISKNNTNQINKVMIDYYNKKLENSLKKSKEDQDNIIDENYKYEKFGVYPFDDDKILFLFFEIIRDNHLVQSSKNNIEDVIKELKIILNDFEVKERLLSLPLIGDKINRKDYEYYFDVFVLEIINYLESYKIRNDKTRPALDKIKDEIIAYKEEKLKEISIKKDRNNNDQRIEIDERKDFINK